MRSSLLAALAVIAIFFASRFGLFEPAPLAVNAAGAAPLRVDRITPEGEDVPAGRQVVIQFNRPVVSLGRMERPAGQVPVTITPALRCQWRWLNTSALACQLGEREAMAPATVYTVRVGTGLRAEDGGALAAPVERRFVTERPRVEWVSFERWQAPTVPVLRARFNLPVTRESVERALSLALPQHGGKRVALQVVELADEARPGYAVLPLPGSDQLLLAYLPGPQAPQDAQARDSWLLAPVEALPADATAELWVAPGLRSPRGPEAGVEARVALRFDTLPEFRFLGVRCTDLRGEELQLAGPDDGRCNPLRSVSLLFSSPVIEEAVRDHVRFTPDLAGGRDDYDPWENHGGYSRLESPHERGRVYPVTLPELLKADRVYRAQEDGELRDEFGRALPQPLDVSWRTDHRAPELVLLHEDAVLEQAVDSELAMAVTNLAEVEVSYAGITAAGEVPAGTRTIALPEVRDVAFLEPIGVRDMLQGRSGALWGELRPRPAAERTRSEWDFFAQVTPFQVHVKLGHFGSLVWVTELASGQPVADAQVSVHRGNYARLADLGAALVQARTDAEGLARLPGSDALDPELAYRYVWQRDDQRLLVKVVRGDAMALLPLDYRFGIDAGRVSDWEVSAVSLPRNGHLRAWGATAQGIYRAGETVRYKLFVRNQDERTLIAPPPGPYTLTVIDPMDREVHRVEALTLSSFGAYAGEFAVPATGAVGWYRFVLTAEFLPAELEPLRVLVSDFTPSPFRVGVELNGERFGVGDRMVVDTAARLHAGGPYAEAPVRVNVRLREQALTPEDPRARGFRFQTLLEDDNRGVLTLYDQEGRVDAAGELRTSFTVADNPILYGELLVESSVSDDRGKSVAGFARARYYGRDRYVGLRSAAWVLEQGKPADIQAVVVDDRGRLAAGTPIELTVEWREVTAARVKGAGNAYLTQFQSQWREKHRCALVSAAEPQVCRFTPARAGEYRVTARISDRRGRPHQSTLWQWSVGKGQVLWSERDDNSLQIVPEQRDYRVGDTARYLVKNPFPGARALITVERYGVLDQWVQTLADSTAVIEVPVKGDYLPGYYLSVVVVSPRVQPPPGDHQLDLGKPAFRMGYVKTEVRDPYKEIEIRAVTERASYKPGETVRVEVSAAPRQGAAGEPIELAVAVLDEAVFDLIGDGRRHFDPYRGFYALDNLDVENYSLLLRLIGRQQFEKKGANAGGDGGAAGFDVRGNFKYVAYWNPALPVEDGKTRFEFQAPDNLTGWKILVLAATPGDRFGLGEGGFTVNKLTELRPAMPNQVLAGDRFRAGVSLMNRTDQARELTVRWQVQGPVQNGGLQHEQKLRLAPFQRQVLYLPVETIAPGELRFTVSAADGVDSDAFSHVLAVKRVEALETAATFGATAEPLVREVVRFPADMREDVGGLALVVSPSAIGNIDGAFRYMRDYPYSSWEQQLSKGVMAARFLDLRPYLPDDLRWDEAPALPARVLAEAAAFQAPNGGMAFFVPDDRYASPYLSAYTALAFSWLRRSGHEVPAAVEQRLHGYLEQLLSRDALPDFYTAGMAATVRAVALAALAERGRVDAGTLLRYRPHAPRMDLFGRAHYLLAALQVPGTEALRAEIAASILAQAVQSGDKFSFNEPWADDYNRILATPARSNCAVLSALTAYAATDAGRATVGDVPAKLARFVSQARGARPHWQNTQENVFCLNALTDYARAYEAASPAMRLAASVDGEPLGAVTFDDPRDPPARLERPLGAGDAGRTGTVELRKEGEGRYYYGLYLNYAPTRPSPERINAGIDVRREYSVRRNGEWRLLSSPARVARGELVRVDLYLSLPTARTFVVVDDPVPGGLEPVNRDLATASAADADAGEFQPAGGSWYLQYSDWQYYGQSLWSFHHRELRHDAARFYAEYLPPGNYHLSYTAQAIADGEFAASPVHAEEMYDPDVFGKGAPAVLRVGE